MVRFAKQNYIGMKHMASAKKKLSSKGPSASARRAQSRPNTPRAARSATRLQERKDASIRHFAICVCNDDYPASLELRKLYAVLEDAFAAEHEMLRIIDESGEDYLYPASYFVRVELPYVVERVLRKIA